jgi:SAM-dependent methyltransferase
MSFDVAADAYDRFMGRYSRRLSPGLADLADVGAGQRALDVGCGPGALTAELVERLGADAVTAVDPSPSFAEAARARFAGAGVDVGVAAAEDLPFDDASFDVALAQLVVHFMADPLAGMGEMRRVTRPGGALAACVWDHAGERGPLTAFWQAVRAVDPDAQDESRLAGAREGHLEALAANAGWRDVRGDVLQAAVEHESFEAWWEPFTLGVGPAGAYVAGLDPAAREELRDRCRSILPDPPFTIAARAWAVRGRA